MAEKEAIAVVLEFMERINAGDAEAICALMTEDHVFVDSLGTRVEGREKMRGGWVAYHKMEPDYKVSHEEILAKGDAVVVLGTARGTYSKDGELKKENFWEVPAAWKAIVRGGLVAYWQVFADNEPIRKLMRAAGP